MAAKQQVIDLHTQHPDWPAAKIAKVLGCSDAYVRATAYREGLTLPYCKAWTIEELRSMARALRFKASRYESRAKALEAEAK